MATYFIKRSIDEQLFAVEILEPTEVWYELRSICCDLVSSAVRGMPVDGKWSIEIQDLSHRPLFKITLIAESHLLP